MATANRNPRAPRSSNTRGKNTTRRTTSRKKKTAAQATTDREVQGLLLVAAGVLMALALYTGTTGFVGEWLADAAGWLLGRARYLLPLALLGLGWHRLRTAPQPRRRSRQKGPQRDPIELGAWLLLFLAAFSTLDLLGGRPWNGSTVDELSGAGGHVGVRIGGTIETMVGHWGQILVTITMVLVAATILTSISAGWVLEAIVDRTRLAAGHVADYVRELDFDTSKLGWGGDEDGERSRRRARGTLVPVQDDDDPLFDIEITTADSGPPSRRSKESAERYIDLRSETSEFEPTGEFDETPTERPPSGPVAADPEVDDAPEPEISVSRFEVPAAPVTPTIVTPTPEGGEWRLPGLGLLERSEVQDVDETEVRDRGKRLERALREHGVETRLIGVRVGPTISMFEYELAPKVKVSRVTSLKHDIAYAMATPDVRILAPIPGKQAIGVEVPNVNRALVTVGDLLVSEEAVASDHPLDVGLGRDITGRTIMINLARMPHLLVAGQTGSGKSSCINTMLTSILMRSTPDQVRLILVDPKRVELTQYEGLPHLLTEVVTDPKKAANALNWGVREMERRYDLLQEVGVRDVTGYNAAVEAGRLAPRVMPDGSLSDYEPLSFVLIVLDELADLMMVAGKEVEESIVRIAQMARAVGIHLVIATQRPSTNVITGLIKANVPARLAFAVSSLTDSRVILDGGGAENLVGRGDGLINDGTTSEPTRFQGAWVTEEEIAEVVDFWRHQAPEIRFDPRVQGDEVDLSAAGLPGGSTGDADDDELLLAAMEIIVSSQRASVSDLQRKLRVGFARAGRLMDELEERGIVGPNVGSKVRDVLVTPADVEAMRMSQARQRAAAVPEPAPSASTLSHIPNPSADDGDAEVRSKALPRPLTDAEKRNLDETGESDTEGTASASEDPDRPDAPRSEDELVAHAAELVVNSQLGSVPMLQRKLRVSLQEAERVMNELEAKGIVGPAHGVRAREVLVQPEDTDERARPAAALSPRAGTDDRGPVSSASTEPTIDLTGELDVETTTAAVPDPSPEDADATMELGAAEVDTAEIDVAEIDVAEIDVADEGSEEFDEPDDDDDLDLDGSFDPAFDPPPGYPRPRS